MILGVLQARASSSRLPGKVLLPVLGAPMLQRQIERIRRAALIDELVIATSSQAEDDAIVNLAASLGVNSFRGSLDDVLDRFYQASLPWAPDYVVRLTGDCPLADWEIIDGCIRMTIEKKADYTSSGLYPTWPDGLDVEVMAFGALRSAWEEASAAYEREHVTPFINRRPERFRLCSYESPIDLSALRWTVDEPRDYELVTRIYENLYPRNPAFRTPDILQLLRQQPELSNINSGIERNEGLRLSEALERK